MNLLQKWSSTMRLVAQATPEALLLHILDSLAVARLPLPDEPMVDIGSGAGFPGLPLAALNPARSILLVESRTRRAAVLQEAVRAMKLSNVTVSPQRFESLVLPAGAFAVGRAVAPPPRFLQMVESQGVTSAVMMINDTMLQSDYRPGWAVRGEDRPPLPFSPPHVNLLCSRQE